MLIILLVRGPHAERYTWFGYEGGMEWRKKVPKNNTANLEESRIETTNLGDDGQIVEVTSTSDHDNLKIRSQELDKYMA